MKPNKAIILFILPGLLLYLIFSLYPTLYGLYISFTDWNGVKTDYNFVGLNNYVKLLTDDTIFLKSVNNNLKFMLFVVFFQTLLSLIFALLLVKNKKINVAYRTLYFFPTILSSVSVAFIWSFMYDTNFGVIQVVLKWLGIIQGPGWLSDPQLAIFSLAFVQVWAHTGQVMIVFIAGLHAIPEELYEVTNLEGATRWQTFKEVTWPLIAPATAIVVAYTTIQSFKAFDLIFAMTRGGPNYSTEILSTFIYNTAFGNYKFGYAAASSMLFMILIAIITIVQFKVLKANRVHY